MEAQDFPNGATGNITGEMDLERRVRRSLEEEAPIRPHEPTLEEMLRKIISAYRDGLAEMENTLVFVQNVALPVDVEIVLKNSYREAYYHTCRGR